MNKIDKDVIAKAQNYVLDFFTENEDKEKFLYHTINHTKYVVDAVVEIGKAEELNTEELDLITFCAWFHDIGYFIDFKNHEEKSKKIALNFLKDFEIENKQIEIITQCILRTRWPQNPNCKITNIMCDADLKHLSDPLYFEFAEQLRQEMNILKGQKMKKFQFLLLNNAFLGHHQYFTKYGKEVLEKGKQKNIVLLNEKIEKSIAKNTAKASSEIVKENEKLKKKLEKAKGYSRGVESMFRLTARNQISLSAIADNKSNILITVNSIIISLSISVLVSQFDDSPALIIPTIIFLGFSLATIIFAILSTRPNISSGKFTKEDIKQNKVNLLFFGNFYNMDYEEYEWAIQELMTNDDYLYSTMTKDQYLLGKVLSKKYKLLRTAYNLFMIGIIVTVIAFIIAHTSL